VYITVSTGIGGVKISGGKVDESATGFEPGHQIINMAELASDTRGELESYASGTALSKKHGKIPSDIHDSDVWKEEARVLAVGLYNTILHWSPHVVVLGGGVVVHADLDMAEVKKNMEQINKVFPRLPEIKKAALEDLGGLYGGLVLLGVPHHAAV
jgi:predicted NBD/HSP70 family sugar kinase